MTEEKIKCVLVHGWGMNRMVWQPLIASLPGWIEVICIDLPGHGEASQASFNSLDDLTQALVNQVDQPAIWIGWSLGWAGGDATGAKAPRKSEGDDAGGELSLFYT